MASSLLDKPLLRPIALQTLHRTYMQEMYVVANCTVCKVTTQPNLQRVGFS